MKPRKKSFHIKAYKGQGEVDVTWHPKLRDDKPVIVIDASTTFLTIEQALKLSEILREFAYR